MSHRIIGYARVSTIEQSADLQVAALEAHGCHQIFCDNGVSGTRRKRSGLSGALDLLSRGDVFVVWKLDRLGRSLPHLVLLLEQLGEQGIGFVSLTEAINTTTPSGRLVFHLLAALAEFERSLISERTRAGMAVARKNGKHLGRPFKLTPVQVEEAHVIIATGSDDLKAVAQRFGVSAITLRRALARSNKPNTG